MDKKLLFDEVYAELFKLFQKTSLETWSQNRPNIQKYINFIDHLINIPLNNNTLDNEEKKVYDLNDKGERESSNNHSDPSNHAYIFERKLKGGYLPDADVFVPESVIRSLGIENGDCITLKPHKVPGKYFFNLKEKSKEPFTDRIEHKFCLVESLDNMLVVRQTLLEGGRTLKYNESDFTFVIKQEDILGYSLENGDIIDIAYWKDSPEKARVIWKHNINEEKIKTPKKSGYYKNKETSSSSIPGEELNSLDQQSILVIGCEPRKAIFKEQIEARGGGFLFADGTEGKDRLAALIQKSDVVVILTSFIRHQASYDAIDLCKEHKKPFSVVSELGIKSIVQGALNPTHIK